MLTRSGEGGARGSVALGSGGSSSENVPRSSWQRAPSSIGTGVVAVREGNFTMSGKEGLSASAPSETALATRTPNPTNGLRRVTLVIACQECVLVLLYSPNKGGGGGGETHRSILNL